MAYLKSLLADIDLTPSFNSYLGGNIPDISSWGLDGKLLEATLGVIEETSQNKPAAEITGDAAFDEHIQMILDGGLQTTQASTDLAILPHQNKNYRQLTDAAIEPPQTSDVLLNQFWNTNSQQQQFDIKEEEIDSTFTVVNNNLSAELTAQIQKLVANKVEEEKPKIPSESSEQKYSPRDTDIDMDGDTPLHILVARCDGGNEQARTDFLNKAHFYKQHVNRQNNDGMTPLHYAVEIGCSQMVQKLLQLGSSLNCFNNRLESPLHVALRLRKDVECFQTLERLKKIVSHLLFANKTKHGKDILDLNRKNKNGLTCVHLACLHQNHEATNLIKSLKSYGADLDEKEDRQGFTPLQFLINKIKSCNSQKPEGMQQSEAYFNTAKYLITQQRVDVTSLSMAEDTALHLACAANHLRLAELLLNREEIEVNLKNAFKKNEKDLADSDEIKNILEVKYRQKRRKRKINDQAQSGKTKKAR